MYPPRLEICKRLTVFFLVVDVVVISLKKKSRRVYLRSVQSRCGVNFHPQKSVQNNRVSISSRQFLQSFLYASYYFAAYESYSYFLFPLGIETDANVSTESM